MAKTYWIFILLFLWLSILVSETALVKIHRAVPRNFKPTRTETDTIWFGFEPCKFLPDFSKIFAKKEAWLYSIPATILVGLCGIFPLLVIPVEAGHALREGVTGDHLKLLLSFAVGGLLGDVFLHLLPEAWAHVHDDGDPHTNHFYIGLWVIMGIFGFLTLEKIFGENEESTSAKKEEVDEEKISSGVVKSGDICNGHVDQETSNGNKNSAVNGDVCNGIITTNGSTQSDSQVRQRQTGKESQITKSKETVVSNTETEESRGQLDTEEDHVRVMGYLNLLANSIDNFTHGLAVAGSFVVSTKMGMCTTCAILLHEIPHEIGDFAILLKSGFRRWDAAVGQMITASAGLCGAVFGLVAEHAGDSTAWVLPFTSGGFIYIAMVTIVPELLQESRPRESLKQILVMLAGITSMGLVSFIH